MLWKLEIGLSFSNTTSVYTHLHLLYFSGSDLWDFLGFISNQNHVQLFYTLFTPVLQHYLHKYFITCIRPLTLLM